MDHDKAIEKALNAPRHRPIVDAMVKVLDGATYLRFTNCTTGNSTTLQFKLLDRRAALRVKVDSRDISDPDREQYVMEELFKGLGEQFPLDMVFDAATNFCGPGSTWGLNRLMSHHLLERAPVFKEVFIGTVRQLRHSGEHLKKSRRHQTELALKDMRGAVMHALKNGASREEMILVIDEAVVREVLES